MRRDRRRTVPHLCETVWLKIDVVFVAFAVRPSHLVSSHTIPHYNIERGGEKRKKVATVVVLLQDCDRRRLFALFPFCAKWTEPNRLRTGRPLASLTRLLSEVPIINKRSTCPGQTLTSPPPPAKYTQRRSTGCTTGCLIASPSPFVQSSLPISGLPPRRRSSPYGGRRFAWNCRLLGGCCDNNVKIHRRRYSTR